MNQTTHHTPLRNATAGIPASSDPNPQLRATTGTPTAPVSFPRSIKALSVSAGIPPAPVSLPRGRAFLTCRLPSPRSAFTLVEMLVVIVILAMLASLVTVAASRALTAARNAAIKAEIDMLHMALMNYKNEYGMFPPCSDVLPPPVQFPGAARSSMNLFSNHIQRIFPRSVSAFVKTDFTEDKNHNGSLASTEDGNGNGALDSIVFDVNTTMPYWLSGFSNDPQNPTLGTLVPLFSFDKSRLRSDGNYFTGQYHSANMPTNGFYRYVDAAHYYFRDASGNRWPMPGVEFNPTTAGMATAVTAFGEDSRNFNGSIDQVPPFTEDANLNGVIDRGIPFNEDTFQIIHPGRDGQFGTDDDLSNFWPGTRKEYRESLNQ